jgi:hypothetical protein
VFFKIYILDKCQVGPAGLVGIEEAGASVA